MKNESRIKALASVMLVCMLLLLVVSCERKDAGQHVDDSWPELANLNGGLLQVESEPSRFQGATNKFVRLDFEKSKNGEWGCAGLDVELLSLEFHNELMMAYKKLMKAQQDDVEHGKYMSLGVKMRFPDDFPFLLRQALIVSVMHIYNLGVETIVHDTRGLLVSRLSQALVIGDNPAGSLQERIDTIEKEYKRRKDDDGCVVSIIDIYMELEGGTVKPHKTYTIKTIADYRRVAQEVIALEGGHTIVWTWGGVDYFEDVRLARSGATGPDSQQGHDCHSKSPQ